MGVQTRPEGLLEAHICFIAKCGEQTGFTLGNLGWEQILEPGERRKGVIKEMGFERGLKDDVDKRKSRPLQEFISRGKAWVRQAYQFVSDQPGLLIHPAVGE